MTMTTSQVLYVMRDHTAVRDGTQRTCTCGSGGRMGQAEHTAHVAAAIAAASAEPPASPDQLLQAQDLDTPHLGMLVTVPVMGLGDVSGLLLGYDPAPGYGARHGLVELTLTRDGVVEAHAVRASSWLSLTAWHHPAEEHPHA